MNQIFIAIFMMLAGSLLAVQGTVNSSLGKYLEEPLHAALISFGSGFVFLCIISIIVTGGLPSFSKIVSAPTVTLTGGFLGVVFVTSIIICVPKIGVANALVASICGQIILSLILDHYGVLGLSINPISVSKLLGVCFIFVGLLLLNYKHFIRALS